MIPPLPEVRVQRACWQRCVSVVGVALSGLGSSLIYVNFIPSVLYPPAACQDRTDHRPAVC